MSRFTHTITLGIAALAVTATAALAAPSEPAGSGMERMHASVHADDHTDRHHEQMPEGAMAAMHEAMADDPQMRAHMERFGVDVDEMDAWMAEGRGHDAIHDDLLARGIDVEEMMQTCPMADAHHRGSPMMHHGHGHGHHDVHERHHRR